MIYQSRDKEKELRTPESGHRPDAFYYTSTLLLWRQVFLVCSIAALGSYFLCCLTNTSDIWNKHLNLVIDTKPWDVQAMVPRTSYLIPISFHKEVDPLIFFK
jgi:hypothetical protein